MKKNKKNRFLTPFEMTKRRGLETVEAALLLPIVLMVTFGALKYGWLFLKYQQLTNAARQVARVAIRPGDRTAEISIMLTSLRSDDKFPATATCTVTPAGGAAAVEGDVVVEVSVAVADVDILPTPGWIPTPATLGSMVTMCKEGP